MTFFCKLTVNSAVFTFETVNIKLLISFLQFLTENSKAQVIQITERVWLREAIQAKSDIWE